MNRFFISGNLTKKPEIKTNDKGINYCKITIANNMTKDKVNYFDILLFDKLATTYGSLLEKGHKILASCYINNNNYESKKECHCKHYEQSIIALSIELMHSINLINQK